MEKHLLTLQTLLSLITIFLGQVQAPDPNHNASRYLAPPNSFQTSTPTFLLKISVSATLALLGHSSVCACAHKLFPLPPMSSLLHLTLPSRTQLLKSVALQLQHPRGLLETESQVYPRPTESESASE